MSRLEESSQAASRSGTLEACWTTSSPQSSIAPAAWPTCLAQAACPTSSTTSSPAPPMVFLKVWPSVETGLYVSYQQYVNNAGVNWCVILHSSADIQALCLLTMCCATKTLLEWRWSLSWERWWINLHTLVPAAFGFDDIDCFAYCDAFLRSICFLNLHIAPFFYINK